MLKNSRTAKTFLTGGKIKENVLLTYTGKYTNGNAEYFIPLY